MALLPFFFFFNDTATTEIYTLSLHDALPISSEKIRVLAADPDSDHSRVIARGGSGPSYRPHPDLSERVIVEARIVTQRASESAEPPVAAIGGRIHLPQTPAPLPAEGGQKLVAVLRG